jgi:hypothetical protein
MQQRDAAAHAVPLNERGWDLDAECGPAIRQRALRGGVRRVLEAQSS